MSLIYFSIAWVTGIFVGNVLLESGLKVSPWYMLLGLIPFPLLFLGIQRKRIILTGICLVIFLGAIGYFQSQLPGVAENGRRFFRHLQPQTGHFFDNSRRVFSEFVQ